MKENPVFCDLIAAITSMKVQSAFNLKSSITLSFEASFLRLDTIGVSKYGSVRGFIKFDFGS
jgi:hypothetical protein